MSDVNVVQEVQRRVRVQIARLRQELIDAGAHPLEIEAITIEEKSDGVVVTVGKVTAAQRRAYDKKQQPDEADVATTETSDEAESSVFTLDESRLDEGAVLGGEESSGMMLDFGSGPDAEIDEGGDTPE